MHEGIYIAASGAVKQSQKLDILANNLANLGNAGFKRDGLAFTEMIPPFNKTAGAISGLNPQRGAFQTDSTVSYVGINELYTDISNGNLRFTGNDLNWGLDGDGFYVVESPQGLRYTRNGNFKLTEDGSLLTQEGHKVIGQNGKPIKFETASGKISINTSGGITIGKGLQNTAQETLKLVDFEEPKKLKKEGNGLFVKSDPGMKEKIPTDLKIKQGFLEESNVSPIEEMIQMITSMRAFESYQKIIQSIDEADDQVVNTVGRVA